MRKLISLSAVAVIAAASLLSSCTSTDTEKIDTQLANTVPKVCNIGNTMYAAFAIVASTGRIKQSMVDRVEAGYAALSAVCTDPENVKASTIPLVVAKAYANFIKSVTEAKTNGQ